MIVFFLSLDSSMAAAKYRGIAQNKPELRYLLSDVDNVAILSQDTTNFPFTATSKLIHVAGAHSNSKKMRSILIRFKYLRWFYFSLFSLFWMMKHRWEIDLIISQNIDSPSPLLFSKIFGIPYVVHYHYDVGYQVKEYNKQPLIGAVLLGLERFAFGKVSAVWVTAPSLVSKVKNFGAKHVQIIPNWFDMSDVTKTQKNTTSKNQLPKRIIFVGRLHPIKQVDLLIRAFAYVYKNDKNTELYILGDGADRQNLISLTENLGLSNVVHFLGFVGREKTYEIMHQSDLLVLPSKLEGNPRVLIEAMANKIPIIGTNVPGINDMIQHMKTGYLFNPSQPDELALGINWMLENGSETATMVKQAYDFADKNFSKKNVSKIVFKEISTLVPKYCESIDVA